MKLVPQHDFHDEAIKWFSSLTEDENSEVFTAITKLCRG